MRAGIAALSTAVNNFASRCPNSQLVIVGYSQGAQVADNSFCGGPDANQGYSQTTPAFSAAAMNQIKAVIEMGNPRFVAGVAYQVGSCRTQGFSPRPRGYSCAVRKSFHEILIFFLRVLGTYELTIPLSLHCSPPAKSRATATARTPTAARATTRTCTRVTARCTDRLRWLSSRVRLVAARVEVAPLLLLLLLPPAQAMRLRLLRRRGVVVLRSGGSVVGRGEFFLSFFFFAFFPGGGGSIGLRCGDFGRSDVLTFDDCRWTGATCCQSGSTCKSTGQWYSQCQ